MTVRVHQTKHPSLRLTDRRFGINPADYFGKLTNREFDIIDVFIIEERAMNINDLTFRLGCKVYKDSGGYIAKVVRWMTHNGLLYGERNKHNKFPLRIYYKPTLDGLKYYYEAMGEEVPDGIERELWVYAGK